MKHLWLIFAQAVTICVAVLFVVQTLKPDWLLANGRLLPGMVSASSGAAAGPRILEAATVDEARLGPGVSYAEAARRAVPTVVHIYTSQEVKTQHNPLLNDPFFRHFFGDRFGEQTQRRSGLGSGVIVSADGYILTNYHVIEGADEIEVSLNDNRKFRAKVIGTDPESDLSVLKIAADGKLPAITFAPANSLRVGDVVLAIGNPFGVGQTVTSGIASALGRTHLGINIFEDFIQTDAAINPGNSGGALVDSTGNMVGVNTAIYSQNGGSMGIGFAIPVSLVRSVLDQIIRSGTVTRGWIGVEVQEITAELAESFKLPSTSGALIAGVMRGSPAEKAGIKPGDLLVSIDGKPVADDQAMLQVIAALPPGRNASFTLRRESKSVELPITIGKRPKPPKE